MSEDHVSEDPKKSGPESNASDDLQNLENEAKKDAEEILADAEKFVLPLGREAAVVAFEEVEAHLAQYAASGSAISGTEAKRIAKLLAELQSLLGLDPVPAPQSNRAARSRL